MRKPIIAGNWKMNKTVKEGIDLINEIKKKNLNNDVEALVCVPFTHLTEAKKALEGTGVKLGAQNVHFEESGAFTGEISPLMLEDIGVDYVILGHSERRQMFNETNEIVNKKIHSALDHKLKPILCVGESLEEREAGKEIEVVTDQVEKSLKGVKLEDMENIVIAYEPIWAIGTGRTASSDDANSMLREIREKLGSLYNDEVKNLVRLQYGGSVKPETIKELMEKPEVDGALVGGASLKAEDFTQLVNF